jgi:HEAT repeat protein
VNDPGLGCQELLRAATVALEIPGQAVGHPIRATGFFVAPGIVATCAHALSDTRATLPGQVVGYLMDGQPITLETVPEWYLRAEPGGLDLALLRAVDGPEIPHVLLSGLLALRDPMWAYGHPAGQFRAGQSAGFRYQGPSRLRPAGGQWEPHRLTGTPVAGGYSGSPVLNLRTGAVCGMLCTSDGAGSAHMVTADDIIAGSLLVREAQTVPTVNAGWLSALSDEQLAEGGWLYPGPRLRAYLDAAVRAAEDHPYPGVVPGVTPPPLTAVYVRQQAETLPVEGDGSPEQTAADLKNRPAEDILGREEDCVLIGGPGAGKSSLLRTALITLARRWQRGEPGTEVPVHVLASDLIPPRPIPDLIAASVTASLSAVGILKSWPPEFFGDSPLRGVRWLVLVDGLDEVLDPVARRRVLDKIAGAGRAEARAPYRFIVATRPLASSEFPSQDAWPAPRYELQLFAAGQLTEFAERWFTELRLTRPDQTARDFLAALDRAGLTDPARTPLMATMLCQLFAANPDGALPAGRAGAYREFVDLLRQRQYEDNASGVYAQMHTLLGPYGPAATGPAGEVLVTALDLIARLALHRQERREGLAVDLLARWTRDNQPRHVPEKRWRAFLRETLRSSGLLTQRADDFQFIHQTVSEFLAAQCVTADADRTAAAYAALFGSWKSDTWVVSSWDEWVPPSWDESYSRFLVAAWPDRSSLVEALCRLAKAGGLLGCGFIASLMADSALPDPAIAVQAAATLAIMAGDTAVPFSARRAACEILARLHDPRGANLLADLAVDRTVSPASRRQAAESLARLGDSRGADLLAVLAGPTEPGTVARRWAAESLARLGDPRGGDQLLNIAADSAVPDIERAEAVHALIRLEDGRRAGQLAGLVANGLLNNESGRREVILTLARLADLRYADMMAALAADSAIIVEERLEVARVLTRSGDHRGVDLLAALAGDGTRSASVRLAAAEALAEVNDSRAAQFLAELAADGLAVGLPVRRQAAKVLAQVAGADLLLNLAVESSAPSTTRYAAAQALAWIGDDRHPQAIACLAADPVADAATRLQVVCALIRIGDRRGPDLVVALTVDPALGIGERREAAWLVPRLKDRRASLLRQILLGIDAPRRRLATAALASLTGGQAVRLLEALTAAWPNVTTGEETQPFSAPEDLAVLAVLADFTDLREVPWLSWDPAGRAVSDLSSEFEEDWAENSIDFRRELLQIYGAHDQHRFSIRFDDFPRRRAAEALAWLGDPQGADFLAAVAADGEAAVHARLDALAALGRLGDHRAADLIMAVIRDQTLNISDRIRAVAVLSQVDEPHLVSGLTSLATDRSLDDDARRATAATLTRFAAAGTEEMLIGIAADSGLMEYIRIGAAEALIRLGDNRGPSLLASLASDPDRAATARIEAAEALAHVDTPRAAAVLVSLSSDRALDTDSRARAAEALARLTDLNTADQLAALGANSSLPVYTRLEVAEALARLGDSRAGLLIAAIADNPAHDPYARGWAADALKGISPAGDH